MIVSSGKGILSVLVLLLTLFLCVCIFPDTFSEYSFIISFFTAGIFSYVFGVKWNHNIKTYIDKETGKEVHLLNNHSLFWIKMQYWGIIFILLGIIILAQNLNREGSELYLNIVLGLTGIICLVLFSINIFNSNNDNNFAATAPAKATTDAKPKFEKVEMEEIKSETEDYTRFLPK